MGFYDKNRYFLQKMSREISIYKNTEKVDDFDEIKNFYVTNFQFETRKRIKKSYANCTNISTFYADLYEYIGEFESDLITINILLEEDLFNILLAMNNNQKEY